MCWANMYILISFILPHKAQGGGGGQAPIDYKKKLKAQAHKILKINLGFYVYHLKLSHLGVNFLSQALILYAGMCMHVYNVCR